MSTQTKVCDACGASVTFTGHRGFKDAHANCPKRGADASSPEHKPCPTHGTLVWMVGPYSSFRQCENRYCTSGVNGKGQPNGKPYRICAPRGTYSEPTPATTTRAPYGLPDPAFDKPATVNHTPATSNTTKEPTPVTTATAVEPTPIVKSTPKATDKARTLPAGLSNLGALGDMIAEYVEHRAAEIASERITEALDGMMAGGPSKIDWTVNQVPFAKIEGTHHKALPHMLKLYAAGFRNFLLVGPAGSGKTTLVGDFARALGKEYATISCSSGITEAKLIGRTIPDLNGGKPNYQGTEFVDCYEGAGRFTGGGVFGFDEFDAADANVVIVANSALANGHMALPDRSEAPAATRHPESCIVAMANTYGNGADRMYAGRNQLDAATLDRFVGSTITVDYDRDMEAALVGDAHICATVWGVRDKVNNARMRRIVGTRFLLSVTRLVKGAGFTMADALTHCTEGWTDDERSKAGVR